MARLDHKRWLDLARNLGDFTSLCQKMKFGAVIVKGNEVLAVGVNQPYNDERCNPCLRIGVKSGTMHEKCRAIHAEQAALLNALNKQVDISRATMYVAGVYPDDTSFNNTGFYCTTCARLLSQTKLRGIMLSTSEGPMFKTLKQALEDSYSWIEDKKECSSLSLPPPLPQLEEDSPPPPPPPPPPQFIKEGEVPKR